MEQQKKDQNEELNTYNGRTSEGEPINEGSHNEGQYQEGKDKPTMSPGSSKADVNPSAKDCTKEND